MGSEIGEALTSHWYLLVGAWYVWKWLAEEKRARQEVDRARREEERKARDEQRETTREVVRDELTKHVAQEAAEFSRFRDDIRHELSGVADLVRQHDQRLRDLEFERKP